MADDAALLATLADIRQRGAIGERSLDGAVAHSDRFAALVPSDAMSLVDLGSGGGLPGLVIAWRHPRLAITLIERRGARADLLRRAVSSLDLTAVAVVQSDVWTVVDSGDRFDVVTARSFGRLATTVDVASRLLHRRGLVLVSEPPLVDRDRIRAVDLRGALLLDHGVVDGIRVLRRTPPESARNEQLVSW